RSAPDEAESFAAAFETSSVMSRRSMARFVRTRNWAALKARRISHILRPRAFRMRRFQLLLAAALLAALFGWAVWPWLPRGGPAAARDRVLRLLDPRRRHEQDRLSRVREALARRRRRAGLRRLVLRRLGDSYQPDRAGCSGGACPALARDRRRAAGRVRSHPE